LPCVALPTLAQKKPRFERGAEVSPIEEL
jgi:hypothetical protein